jgi:hypothetical protein
MTTWYLCLSAYEGDVPRTWCNRIGEHFAHYSIEGAVALERSKHSNCLHCVSVFETHSFGDAGTARLLYAQLRAFISIALGTHVKLRMKQLAADQTICLCYAMFKITELDCITLSAAICCLMRILLRQDLHTRAGTS